MVNSFDLIVFYQNRQHSFHIEPDIKLSKDILRLIGDYFHININDFVVEAYDKRYKLYIVLDKYYLNELQSDPYFAENNSVEARVRSRQQSSFNTKTDTDQFSSDTYADSNVRPDHVIIWLDQHIGEPSGYQMLKRRYKDMVGLNEMNSMSSRIDDMKEIDRLINYDSVNYLIPSSLDDPLLYIFSDILSCIEFINRISQSKRTIFLITSGSLGRIIIPQIYDNIHIYAIYILVTFISDIIEWVLDYLEKLNVFNDDRDLFIRLTRDIAEYYVQKGSMNTQNLQARLLYLKWAQILYKKADKNDGPFVSHKQLKETDEFIKKLEHLISLEPEETPDD